MKKRNTLSLREKFLVVEFLKDNADTLKLISLKALSVAIQQKTGIYVDPTVVGVTYRTAADYPPLVEARKDASEAGLVERVAHLEAQVAALIALQPESVQQNLSL